MYMLETKIARLSKTQFSLEYKLTKDSQLLESDVYVYTPRTHAGGITLRQANMNARWALRTSLARRHNTTKIRMVCTTSKEDFIKDEKEIERAVALLHGAPQPITPSAPKNTERLYEVVKVGDVWTIVKHENPFYTAEEAKTQLFAKVVNGD